MLNFVWAPCAVKHQGPLQYTLSVHVKFSTLSVHNGEKPDTKNASYVRRKHFKAVSEGFEPKEESHPQALVILVFIAYFCTWS